MQYKITRRQFYRAKARLAVLIIIGILMLSGCGVSKGEGFAIYLTAGDIPPAQMQALSHVNIEEQPVIGISDIISYDARTHEITLTARAFERISRLEVPVRGRSFAVCVDRKPVYWGAFWTPISSLSFDGVTIMKPLSSEGARVIKIVPGYPVQSFYKGEDPRSNAGVMKSLEQAGKLK